MMRQNEIKQTQKMQEKTQRVDLSSSQKLKVILGVFGNEVPWEHGLDTLNYSQDINDLILSAKTMKSELGNFEFKVGDRVVKAINIMKMGTVIKINAATIKNGVGNVFILWDYLQDSDWNGVVNDGNFKYLLEECSSDFIVKVVDTKQ